MKKMLLLLVAMICLAAMPALANKVVTDPLAKSAVDVGFAPSVDPGRDYFESFEGAFPPAGWTHTITNPSYTWHRYVYTSPDGVAHAHVPWQAGVPQNEVLSFQRVIAAGEHVLSFATMGSVYWCVNADFTVEVNGVQVFSFCTDATTGSWVWENYSIDLSAWIGQNVTIAFRYAGDDGADHHFDAVSLGSGPPPPPVACDYAVPLDCTTLTISGDTCDSQNFVWYLPSCALYTENGLEDWYEFTIGPGGGIAATITGAADNALWVLGNCDGALNSYVCLAYADDGYVSGDTESIEYTNNTMDVQTIYLVIDSWGTNTCGTYTGTVICTGGVIPTDMNSWGGVKALFQ